MAIESIELAQLTPTIESTETIPFLLVFVNSKSGGRSGANVFKKMSLLLSEQAVASKTFRGAVFDLANVSKNNLPQDVISKYLVENHNNVRLFVCGGDGTQCWILSAIHSLNLNFVVPLGIMPLGTGNDLSQVYGWGKSCSSSFLRYNHVKKVITCQKVETLDLWRITFTMNVEDVTEEIKKWWPPGITRQQQGGEGKGEGGGGEGEGESLGDNEQKSVDDGSEQHEEGEEKKTEEEKENTKVMMKVAKKEIYSGLLCNYFSLHGPTARVALEFHKEREARPGRFTSQAKNKCIYATKAAAACCCTDCCCAPRLAGKISLSCDTSNTTTNTTNTTNDVMQEIDFPSHLCELNLLNIQSYSGGEIRLPKQYANDSRNDDGMLCVVGLGDWFRTGCAVACSPCCRFTPLVRAKKVKIEILENLTAQFDGEPFLLPARTTIELSLAERGACVLNNKK